MLTILGALCTALLSGVVAAFATYSMSSNKDHVFFIRQKAEELFISFEYYATHLDVYIVAHYPFLKGEISHLDLLQRVKHIYEDGDNRSDPPKKVEMIVSIYFPEIDMYFRDVLRRLSAVNQIISMASKSADANGGKVSFDRDKFWDFHRHCDALANAQNEFRRAIVQRARIAAGAEALMPPMIVSIRERIRATRSISPDG